MTLRSSRCGSVTI